MPVPRLPLFVYGTLRPGGSNHARYLQPFVQQTRPATLAGQLLHVRAGDYPYLLAGGGLVHGELVDILPQAWPQVLAALDDLEEYFPDNEPASWYLRRQAQACLADGTEVTAWVYFWNRSEPRGELIVSGDWFRR